MRTKNLKKFVEKGRYVRLCELAHHGDEPLLVELDENHSFYLKKHQLVAGLSWLMPILNLSKTGVHSFLAKLKKEGLIELEKRAYKHGTISVITFLNPIK